jgi:hypothetical protein
LIDYLSLATSVAGGFLVFAYFALALFQLAIVLGAPLGEYAYGGQRVGVLPAGFRVASVASAIVAIAIGGHYLAQLGLLPTLLPTPWNVVVNWALVAFAALAALANNMTRSAKEKRLWGATTIAMALSALVIALHS